MGAPQASAQSAGAQSAGSASGGGGGTTIGIAVYRSSFDSKWHLNDEGDYAVKASYGATELPKEVTPGVVATLPEGSDPSRAGYEFLGWNTEPDGSGARIGVDVTPQPTEGEELEFYAIWKAIPYTVVFDLSKNPDEVDLAASLVWPGHSVAESSKNVFVAEGVTVEMGPEGRVELPDGRGAKRTDYRFLGWAEGEGVPVSQDADGTWRLDVSALGVDQEGATLIARWAFKFGVIVPSDITFGRYDLLSQAGQGYATDESSSQDKLDGADGTAGTGEAAYFQSSTLSADLELAGLQSVKADTASDVLFAKQGSQDQIWGQDLLSLFPLPSGADGAEAHGVHFKLDDAKDESAFEGKGFGIPKDSKLYASYRLNLDTAWSDGTSNSAIVGNGVTADNAKTRIAKVSYEFAVAGDAVAPSVLGHVHGSATGTTDDDIYIEYQGAVYGTDDIVAAADCISAHGEGSPCHALYDAIMRAQGVPSNGVIPSDAGAKAYARYLGPEATASQPNCKRAGYVRLLLVGINHDALELSVPLEEAYDGTETSSQVAKRAGLTFQFADVLLSGKMKNSDGTSAGGWRDSDMRQSALAPSGSIQGNLPIASQAKPVYKFSNNELGGKSTSSNNIHWSKLLTATRDTLFLPSYIELWNTLYGGASEFLPTGYCGWLNFEGYQYEYWDDVCGVRRQHPDEPKVMRGVGALSKQGGNGSLQTWWMRDPYYNNNATYYCHKSGATDPNSIAAPTTTYGIAPCFAL